MKTAQRLRRRNSPWFKPAQVVSEEASRYRTSSFDLEILLRVRANHHEASSQPLLRTICAPIVPISHVLSLL
jgi:hypothetical protein